MLLQASCAARLGNSLGPKDTDLFIVMALYIDNVFQVDQYLLYQPDRSHHQVSIEALHDLKFSTTVLGFLC
jgi:hypothetical protein